MVRLQTHLGVMQAEHHPQRRRQLYGRRQGPALSARQAGLIDNLLPQLRAEPGTGKLIDPRQLFRANIEDVWLEIGFGGGEHLAWQAAAHRTIGFIGCEAYVNGIAKLLVAIEDHGLDNVRLHDGDARELVADLGDGSIGRIFLLFPDPWPKRRHHKRRIVTPAMLGEFHRILRPGGLLRFASDSRDYVAWTLIHVRAHGGFEWLAEAPRDWRERPPDWPQTRYEAKARREGRNPMFLSFQRQ
jgi:tRNA (guanine-N7-)-methyltransferase